jgi:hypothetical protein
MWQPRSIGDVILASSLYAVVFLSIFALTGLDSVERQIVRALAVRGRSTMLGGGTRDVLRGTQ